jgi:hypothetical protein
MLWGRVVCKLPAPRQEHNSLTSQQLMKFTGDLKAMPYRELMAFSEKLSQTLQDRPVTPAALAEVLVSTAEQINPDQLALKGTYRDRD